MEIMISVNPPYSDMIFSGYKPFEFRKRVLKGMDTGYPTEDIKAYIYETKNKGGTGKVIGEITISGAYSLHYGDRNYFNQALINERCAFTKRLYLLWCERKSITPNMNEGWFNSKKYNKYENEIGFYEADGSLSCNYALIINNPVRYDTAKSLTDYATVNGAVLNRPPQNMFNVKMKGD